MNEQLEKTEWDEWDELVQQGYDAQDSENTDEMFASWWKAWEIFQDVISRDERKKNITWLMEEQDYEYPVDDWLLDFEMELGNAEKHEERLSFCRKVLEILDWKHEDDSDFLIAVGEALYDTGKPEEGREWFRTCLEKHPHDENILFVLSWCIQQQEGEAKAYELLRREVKGIPCTAYNSLLFERGRELASHLHLDADLKWIESQLESFRKAMDESNLYDDFIMPVQQPIVKEKKIYPNDPCPCGSGKKYKKCCGKNS